jgi:hypothetical protein
MDRKAAARGVIRSDLCRSPGLDSLATRCSPAKRMRVPVHEKSENA